MPRYSVSSYTFLVTLAFGKLEIRIRCPACDSLHANIRDGEESWCVGCGQTLTVRGPELFVYVIPDGSLPREDDQSEDKPDNPTFWFRGDN